MGRWREDKYRLYSNQDTGKQEAPNCAQSAETWVTWFQKWLSNLSCFLPRLDFYWDYFSVFQTFQKLAPEKAQWREQNMTNLEHSPYHFRMCRVKYLTCMYVTRLWGSSGLSVHQESKGNACSSAAHAHVLCSCLFFLFYSFMVCVTVCTCSYVYAHVHLGVEARCWHRVIFPSCSLPYFCIKISH